MITIRHSELNLCALLGITSSSSSSSILVVNAPAVIHVVVCPCSLVADDKNNTFNEEENGEEDYDRESDVILLSSIHDDHDESELPIPDKNVVDRIEVTVT